jgi:hypothetical protein
MPRSKSPPNTLERDCVEESGVITLLDELLSDLKRMEDDETVSAARLASAADSRRLAAVQLADEAAEARFRAESGVHLRRVSDEQKRQAELKALRDTTLADARMAAEERVRAAEIAVQLEHERLLGALRDGSGASRMRAIAGAAGLVAVLVAGTGGAMLQKTSDDASGIERERARLHAQADRNEALARRFRAERDAADAEKIAGLERRVKDAERAARVATETRQATKPRAKTFRGRVGTAPPAEVATPAEPPVAEPQPANAANCPPSDPMCS